ncbi:hypothetical protein [uncultured Sphingomonas sp.]|uniref:hypothetical protein n=1 Tax=uncultured Sphingomonas sp. TaxID=158754 RepID=UPI0025FC5958|nr:hypothetical protein [uncultured Sphingomonas sp.]
MFERTLADEANECRTWAEEFQGTPEQPFFQRLADEFDRLAFIRLEPGSYSADDASYYARRAAQEMLAGRKAHHPKARAAHLAIAAHYRRVSLSISGNLECGSNTHLAAASYS